MRRFLVLAVFTVLFSTSSFAAPAYGTKMPQKNEWFWGLQQYRIMERDLNKDHGTLKSQQGHYLLSYGVTDWFVLDLKAGSGTITHENSDGQRVKYKNPIWGGGYGFRIRLYEGGPVKVVTGFQHISIHPKTVKANGIKQNAILDDWQGSALVSYDLKTFTPYTGLRYGSADYLHRIDNDADRHLVPQDRRYDVILGVDIPFGTKVWANIEGALGGGSALATSLNFKF